MEAIGTIAVGITNKDWYQLLRSRDCRAGVNFWRPSMRDSKLEVGEWLLFKLYGAGKIAGGARFISSELQTVNLAWSRWGQANGCADKQEFLRRLSGLRDGDRDLKGNSLIRCLYLDEPVFLPEEDWFEVPGWNYGSRTPIRMYPTDHPHRPELQRRFEAAFRGYQLPMNEFMLLGEKIEREGQYAFRKEILKNYQSQCAVTGEKTEPVLEAAHIRPYAKYRNHLPSNGLLLKSDIHKLYDEGLVSITPDLKFHVSSQIKRKYSNGKYYYELEGKQILVPKQEILQPNPEYLQEHYEKKFNQ